MEKHWYGTGTDDATNSNGADASHYSYWFVGDGIGNRTAAHVAVADGLPKSGDTVYWDGGIATMDDDRTWDNVTVPAHQAIVMHGNGNTWTLHSNCVLGVGCSLTCDVGGVIVCGAQWLGDVVITANQGAQLATGWSIPARANISLTSTSSSVTVASAAGSMAAHNIALSVGVSATVNLASLATPLTLTGALTYSSGGGRMLSVPSGPWLTLGAPGATAFGVVAGALAGAGPNSVLVV